MTNIVPNVMAQTNMTLLNENYKTFQPIASSLFTYNGPATDQTDEQIKNARTLLQNIMNILPSLMQAINDTPTVGVSIGISTNWRNPNIPDRGLQRQVSTTPTPNSIGAY